jgi:hypothetical protein
LDVEIGHVILPLALIDNLNNDEPKKKKKRDSHYPSIDNYIYKITVDIEHYHMP